jgi:cytochrome P450/NADPH-cytochrome P450 reductase
MCDALFEQRGAERIAERGVGDAGGEDMFEVFDKWQDEHLWPAIVKRRGSRGSFGKEKPTAGLDLTVSTQVRASALRQELYEAVITDSTRLTPEKATEKRHIATQLPTGISYKTGDYLAVLPMNPASVIRRAMKRFNLAWDAMITICKGSKTTIPTEFPISAFDIFASYVELALPATRKVSLHVLTFFQGSFF